MEFSCSFLKAPCVIDEDLLYDEVIRQGPKGEAGKFFKKQGVEYEKVPCLRLEYLDILKIENIWKLTSLTILQLSNNIIETIENLEALVSLKKLDLSFNKISKIQNLGHLVNLEVLSLFENKISVLENLENLQKLNIFSIGNNALTDKNDIFHLRLLNNLQSLNLAGNPVCIEENFREFVCAFLPNLVYYEYKMIHAHQRLKAMESLRTEIDEFEKKEVRRIMVEGDVLQKQKQEIIDKEAFAENLGGEELFVAMYLNDPDGKTLLEIPEISYIHREYMKRFCEVTSELHSLALEEVKLRKQEIAEYESKTKEGIADVYSESRKVTEEFRETKIHLFKKVNSLLEGEKNEFTDKDQLSTGLKEVNEEFQKICLRIWHALMKNELYIFEALEKIIINFERNITQLINDFIESAQAQFTQLRDLQDSFQEEVVSKAEKYFTALAALLAEEKGDPYSELSPELFALVEDHDVLVNALSSSQDGHIFAIDSREDQLMSTARHWVRGLVDEIKKAEIERHRLKILEINHFVDSQREEFQALVPSSVFVNVFTGAGDILPV